MNNHIFRRFFLPDGSPAAIIMLAEAIARANAKCFRGPSKRCAGNTHWLSVYKWLYDPHTRLRLKESITSTLHKLDRSNSTAPKVILEIVYPTEIGWAYYDDRRKYSDDMLAPPSRQGEIVREIDATRTDVLAPRTNLMNVRYEVTFRAGVGWLINLRKVLSGHNPENTKGKVPIWNRGEYVLFTPLHPGV